jgi:hypothetical protein
MKLPFEGDGINEIRRLNLARQITTHTRAHIDMTQVMDKLPAFIPPNVDILKNSTESRSMGPYQLLQHFKSGGVWDYKKGGNQYEDFGNFHFGFILSRLRFPADVAKMGAGLYQVYSGTSPLRKDNNGKSREIGWLEPFEDPNWGDDPKDQEQINNAYELDLYFQLLELDNTKSDLRIDVNQDDSSNSHMG